MATPEQNALLALQLFAAPAQQFNAQNDARTNLLYRLTESQSADDLKRELANMQATREDARWKAAGEREDARATAAEGRQKTQIEAMQTREDTRVTESERRQNAAIDAREKAQITAEMNKLYPQYAAAAARSGSEIKQRSDYASSSEGLGQLAADLKTEEVGFEQSRLRSAADAIMSEYDDGRKAIERERNRLAALGEPSAKDQKYARQEAVAALKKGIDNGDIASATKLSKKAITDGVAALGSGDDTIGKQLLGDEAFGAFQRKIDEVLMGLPNTKSRMQERAQSQQQLLALQSQTSRIESDVRKAAATNPFLAEQFKSKSPLQDLMTTPQARQPRPFAELPPPVPDGLPQPTPAAAPVRPNVGSAGIGAPPTNLYSLMQAGAPPSPAPTDAPPEDVAPGTVSLTLGDRIGHGIRNMLGLSPMTPEGYAYDLPILNNQLLFQNERGRAETLRQIQQLLLQAQTDPSLAPRN